LSEDELEQIRQRKLAELKKRMAEEQSAQQAKEEYELKKAQILRQILSPEARGRLTNIKMVKPQFAEQLENHLIGLLQSGYFTRMGVALPISDEQFKVILQRLQGGKRNIRIKFR